jgi:hypothetical protein
VKPRTRGERVINFSQRTKNLLARKLVESFSFVTFLFAGKRKVRRVFAEKKSKSKYKYAKIKL